MKKFNLLFAVLSTALILVSCSSEEELTNVQSENLLKSYTLKKDVNGFYYFDYTLAKNTAVDVVKNTKTNTNEIYLSKTNTNQKRNHSTSMELESNKLKIGFFFENSNENAKILVEDENLKLGKGSSATEYLKDYSIVSNGDGTYKLDFKVNEGTNVSFTYNEELRINEIHLTKGAGNGDSFSKVYSANDESLRIDFVNHKRTAAKGAEAEAGPRRPRLFVMTVDRD